MVVGFTMKIAVGVGAPSNAFVFFASFSYTRLVHILVAPVPYLWRPLQVAIWNRPREGKVAP